MAISDKIFSSTIKNQVSLDRYSYGLARQIQRLLTEAQQEIVAAIAKNDPTMPSMTKWKAKRLSDLNDQISQIIDSKFKDIKKVSKAELAGLAKIQSEKIVEGFNKSIGVDIFGVTLTPEGMKSIVENSMINGRVIGDWWDKQKDDVKSKLQAQMTAGTNAIQIGLVKGESVGELISRIRGTRLSPGIMSITKREATALARTSVMQVANNVRLETYKENADVLEGIEIIVTLDKATCMRCAVYDGKRFDMEGNPIDHSLPYPELPLHFNCRCTTAPFTKSYSELIGSKSPLKKSLIRDMDANIPDGERSAMNGPISGGATYDDWLRSQSVQTQKSILGKGKYELWSENKLGTVDLVDNSGRPLTLKELSQSI